MRQIFVVALLALLPAKAFSTTLDAPGKVFYKMPNGEIVTREATLEVPARGQGDVRLKGSHTEITARRFFSRSHNQRTIFYVIFDEYPGQQQGDVAVYRGTYSRGSNMAIYYGDVFIMSEEELAQDDLHAKLSEGSQTHDHVKYVAGFYFRAEI